MAEFGPNWPIWAIVGAKVGQRLARIGHFGASLAEVRPSSAPTIPQTRPSWAESGRNCPKTEGPIGLPSLKWGRAQTREATCEHLLDDIWATWELAGFGRKTLFNSVHPSCARSAPKPLTSLDFGRGWPKLTRIRPSMAEHGRIEEPKGARDTRWRRGRRPPPVSPPERGAAERWPA